MERRGITLEMSLKPFRERGEAALRRVAEELFDPWTPLLRESPAEASNCS